MITVTELNYKAKYRQKKRFLHSLNSSEMLTEIKHELTDIKDTSLITSEQA